MTDNQLTEEQAFQAFDTSKIVQSVSKQAEELASKKAEEIAEKKVQERLSSLGDVLSGKTQSDEFGFSSKDANGNPAPKTWGEVGEKLTNKAVERAKQEIMGELEKKREIETKKQQFEAEQYQQKQKEMYASWDRDWENLIAEGEMPPMSDDTRKKLQSNISDDEKVKLVDSDQGLRARKQLLESALRFKQETGKDVNLYWFAKNRYKNSMSRTAPVFGGGSDNYSPDPEPDYDKIHAVARRFVR